MTESASNEWSVHRQDEMIARRFVAGKLLQKRNLTEYEKEFIERVKQESYNG